MYLKPKQNKSKFVHYKNSASHKRIIIFIKVAAIILILLCSFKIADNFIRPIITAYAYHVSQNTSTILINDSINSYLSESNLKYDDLVKISRTSNNTISSIETDMMAINKARSEIIDKIDVNLKDRVKTKISVPVGSLTNSIFLSGRGFNIDFYIIPTSIIKSEFKNNFISAGINQTRHQIIINISLDISCSIPIYESKSTINYDVVLCETLIVGDVPNYILKPQ